MQIIARVCTNNNSASNKPSSYDRKLHYRVTDKTYNYNDISPAAKRIMQAIKNLFVLRNGLSFVLRKYLLRLKDSFQRNMTRTMLIVYPFKYSKLTSFINLQQIRIQQPHPSSSRPRSYLVSIEKL